MLLCDGSDWEIAFRRLLPPKGDDALQRFQARMKDSELDACAMCYIYSKLILAWVINLNQADY